MKMKNKFKFIILICSLIFVLSSCSVSSKKTDFEINTPKKILMGDSSLKDFYITVKGKKIPITMDMFEDGTETSLYKEGTQTITISYKNNKKSTTIEVVRRDFSDAVKFKDAKYDSETKIYVITVMYTGEKYEIEVLGNLPANVNIYYPYGNEFSEVGEYTVKAILSAPHYNTLTLEAKLTIKAVENNEE